MSKISIVVPCYNAQKYIDRCIEAFERQSFKDFEVIAVDDASSDNTFDMLNDLKQRVTFQLNVLQNKENSGPSITRNKAICAATSDYICFCDSDDWYEDDFLAKMIETIENTQAEIAFCGYKVVSDDAHIEYRRMVCKKSVMEGEEALYLDADSLCMMIVKSEIMKNTLLPNLRNGEDMAVIPLLIAKAKRCAVIDQCLYNYYRNSGSASQSVSLRVVDSLIASFEYIRENLSVKQEQIVEYIGIRNLLYPSIITLFSISYNTQKAKEIISNFEQYYPSWHRNKIISSLPKYKRVVLFLTKIRCYIAIYIIACLRKQLIGK